MDLIEEDIAKIRQMRFGQFADLRMGKVYVKEFFVEQKNYFCHLDLAINEVIGSKIAKEMGLMCPTYKVVMPDREKSYKVYVVSDDLNNYGKFYTFEDLEMPFGIGMSIYEIRDFLEYKKILNENIFADIIKVYIYDILLGNRDRFHFNWGLIFMNDNKVQLAIFDNECILDYHLPAVSSEVSGDAWYATKKNSRDNKATLKEEIRQFLTESGDEFLQMFKDTFTKFTPDYFSLILDSIELEEKIYTEQGEMPLIIKNKNKYVENYKNNYDLIQGVLKEFNKGRKLQLSC